MLWLSAALMEVKSDNILKISVYFLILNAYALKFVESIVYCVAPLAAHW